MTNIQMLFFAGMFVVCTVTLFAAMYQIYKTNKRLAELESSNKKALDFCNTLYDKLKEIVNKINPLLEAMPDDAEVHEAEIKEGK